MRYIVFDIEADGLLNKATKTHCMSWMLLNENLDMVDRGHTDSPDYMRLFFKQDAVFIGHNIIRFDFPLLNKLYNISVPKRVIDTLGLSWYLFIDRKSHGLESWGEYFGTEKPKIDDWENLSIEDYYNRCDTDVFINAKLFGLCWSILNELYDRDPWRIVGYLNFKLDCLREQESIGIKLDVTKCQSTINKFENLLQEKIDILKSVMPKDLGSVIRVRPKIMTKKDGTVSAIAEKWFELLKSRNLPIDTQEVREEPNPGSNDQLKKWLFRLGWVPDTFKESKQTGEKIPQINIPGQGLSQSVKDLYPVCPELESLDSYFVLRHRIGVLTGYLESKDGNDMVYASANGFTRTMRMKHSKPVVNLPKITKQYSKQIRECLTVPGDDYIMCGADLSSLEDNTKQHYIYFFDPEYVKEMGVPGFDPHLDIAIKGGLMTEEEGRIYKELKHKEDQTEEEKAEFLRLGSIRSIAKNGNFAMTYNAFPPKIAETIKKPLEVAQKLFDTYWERNRAIKAVEASVQVKRCNGSMWLFNPVSQFWYSLKVEKDKFSTLNQSTGVYFFDSWLRRLRQLFDNKIKVCLQYHDELAFWCHKNFQSFASEQLHKSIALANQDIQLNVEIGISEDWGKNYGDVH